MNTQKRNYRNSWLRSLIPVKLTPVGARLTRYQTDTSLGEDISSLTKASSLSGFFITGFSNPIFIDLCSCSFLYCLWIVSIGLLGP